MLWALNCLRARYSLLKSEIGASVSQPPATKILISAALKKDRLVQLLPLILLAGNGIFRNTLCNLIQTKQFNLN